MKKNEKAFAVGSGNIFEDLGFSEEESAALTLKSSLFNTLQMALRELTGTQAEVAAKLGIPQPKVSDILNGKQSGFSVERLASYLLKLNYDICVDAHPAPNGAHGRVINSRAS